LEERARRNIAQITLNWNIVRQTSDSRSIALVPRSKHGRVYAGYLGNFELADNPPWLDEALALRDHAEKDSRDRYGLEFVQVWHVREWRRIPYSQVPNWLIPQLSFRNLVRRVKAPDLGEVDAGWDPYGTVVRLMDAGT
jgi:hypothetical protein